MPSKRIVIPQPRKAAILRDFLAGVKPLKQIAGDWEVKESWLRSYIAELGYSTRQISQSEWEALLRSRACDTALQTIINSR